MTEPHVFVPPLRGFRVQGICSECGQAERHPAHVPHWVVEAKRRTTLDVWSSAVSDHQLLREAMADRDDLVAEIERLRREQR